MPAEAGFTSDPAIEAAREEAAYSLALQAYLWGRPLLDYGRSVPAAIRAGDGRLNRFCKTAVPGAGSEGIDTCGFWDARSEPVCVSVPEQTNGRGYVVQFADMFGIFFHTLGGRQGAQPGLYVLAGPGDGTPLPRNAVRLRPRTRMGVCVVRIFGGGEAGFQMMPLSAWIGKETSVLPLAPYDCGAPHALLTFDRLGYWIGMAFPSSADIHDTLLASFRLIGLSATSGFNWRTLDGTVRRGVGRAIRRVDEMVDAGRGAAPLQADAPVSQWQAALTGYRLTGHLIEDRVCASCGMTC